MCPACITTATLMFAGVTSAGGLAALVVKKIRPRRSQAKESEMKTDTLPTKTDPHRVASREEWIAARVQLLEKEKELTRQRDAVNAERRELPWVKLEEPYVFDTQDGKATLADLFDGRSQLIVYHFMFGPGWQEGCPSCSFLADHVDGALVHLAARDVSFVAVSRAPLAQIQPFQRRMGWRFKWVSSDGSDFNYDFHVSSTPDERANGRMHYNYREVEFEGEELHGTSVFYKDAGGAIHGTVQIPSGHQGERRDRRSPGEGRARHPGSHLRQGDYLNRSGRGCRTQPMVKASPASSRPFGARSSQL